MLDRKKRRHKSWKVKIRAHETFAEFKYKSLFEGILVGAFAGLVVGLFRYVLTKVDEIREDILTGMQNGFVAGLFMLGIMVICMAVVVFLMRKVPYSASSGIPQVKAELSGIISVKWLDVMIAKFVGAVLAIAGGLALGREGPSVQLGAMAGKGVSRLHPKFGHDKKLLMICGSGAGLAAAFSAPLAATVFTMEEMEKEYDTEVLMSTMAASIVADWMAQYAFGLKPILSLDMTRGLPLSHYWMIVVMGIVLGFFGYGFNEGIVKTQKLFKKLRKPWLKMAVTFAVTTGILFFYPKALGSGHALFGYVGNGGLAFRTILVLLIVKFLFSIFSSATGAPGGSLQPLLVMGAISGGFFTAAVSPMVGYTEQYSAVFVILGMAGYFAACVRAPLTGIILITEMTGVFTNLLPLAIVSFFSYLTAEMIGSEPLYDLMTRRFIAAEYKKNKKKYRRTHTEVGTEIILENPEESKSVING